VIPVFFPPLFQTLSLEKGVSVVGRMDKHDKAHDWILVHVVFSALGAQSRKLLAGYVSLEMFIIEAHFAELIAYIAYVGPFHIRFAAH
jgi:hypothetical protein